MKHCKQLFIFLLFCIQITAEPIITNFNYQTDMPAIETLIKKEWNALFWMPQYDQNLVDIIFKQQKPGNLWARGQSLKISVLKENAKLIGFITYYQSSKDTGDIELLAIERAYKGLGYGKKLINYAKNWFIRIGCKHMQLYVYTSNNSAIEFYKHIGFSIKNSFPGYLLFAKQII